MKKLFLTHIYTQLKNSIVLLAVALISFTNIAAQSDSKGKDFWLMFNTNYDLTGGLKLFITSGVNTSGTVSGASFATINYTVTANTVTTVTIPIGTQTHTSDVIDNKGIHVVANDDVTVYGLNQRGASTDAFLGLPTDVLGTDYMVLTYKNVNVVNGVQLGVVATENGTSVTITPTVTTGARTAGVPYTITMNQGQAYQLQNGSAAPADLTGTIITSDKPIGVFGAAQCANIPQGYVACDHICEMIPPRTTWGKKFGTVPLKTRKNGDTWRFLATENTTTITINGTVQTPINKGQYLEKILTVASIVESDKPILAAQYSNGTSYDGVTSDPFMMLIPPLEQFLPGYTLGTPATGFSGHYVNLIVPNSVVGVLTMDGSPVASSNYTAIGSSGFSGAQLTVTAGSHTFASTLPFGAFQYGFGSADSYGYAGGQSFSPVATVSSLKLTPETGTAQINTNKCWEALVKDQFGVKVKGVKVDFDITGPNSASSGFANTDTFGIATFCYSGPNGGSDDIRAHVGTIGDTSNFVWVACTSPAFATCPSDISESSSSTYCDAAVGYNSVVTGTNPTVSYVFSGATTGSGNGNGAGSTFGIGATLVELTATNACGTANCSFTVTVKDNTKPTVNTQDVTVYLDANGEASVTTADINDGSTDNCGIDKYELDITDFDCSNVGDNTVTLTVTDVNGNSDSKQATVTVKDNIKPTVNTQNVTIYLDANGAASVTAADINDGSTDNCGIDTYELDITDFDCSDLGDNTVTLTVKDIHGNSNTGEATVTVKDAIAPVAKCKSINITLTNGTKTITASDIDDGSTDNCGVASLTLSKYTFTCSDNGVNDVTLYVKDAAGNVSSCSATVTVSVISSASAGPDRVVYYGAPSTYSCATLTGSASGGSGYSYSWSTSATTQSITVCPSATTTYTVTVTDNQGCQESASVDVCAFDVRCGKKMDKVMVCHNTNSKSNPNEDICIASSAVADHLNNHGDKLGDCGTTYTCGSSAAPDPNQKVDGYSLGTKATFIAYPNPFTTSTDIMFSVPTEQKVTVKVYSITGQVVATLFDEITPANQAMVVNFNAGANASGIFIVRMVTEKGLTFESKLIRTN